MNRMGKDDELDLRQSVGELDQSDIGGTEWCGRSSSGFDEWFFPLMVFVVLRN